MTDHCEVSTDHWLYNDCVWLTTVKWVVTTDCIMIVYDWPLWSEYWPLTIQWLCMTDHCEVSTDHWLYNDRVWLTIVKQVLTTVCIMYNDRFWRPLWSEYWPLTVQWLCMTDNCEVSTDHWLYNDRVWLTTVKWVLTTYCIMTVYDWPLWSEYWPLTV